MSTTTQASEYRLKVLARIKELERSRQFDQDVEDDPPFHHLKKGEVDYLRKKPLNALRAKMATHKSTRYFNSEVKKHHVLIENIEGIEILQKIKTGAVLTQNHFSPYDGIPIHRVMNKYIKKKTLYTLIKEGNYSYPGLFGYFMRNCYTIPLSTDYEVMKEMNKAITTLLAKGNFLLVYAEQSMWWNYRKPKPLKSGAFAFACRHNVPVVPMFITMKDSDYLDPEGMKVQSYTLHILSPIYPDPLKSEKENVAFMKEENEKMCRICYEKAYKTPLIYLTEEKK